MIKRGLVQAHAQEPAEQVLILQPLAELPVAADGMRPDQQLALQERLRGNRRAPQGALHRVEGGGERLSWASTITLRARKGCVAGTQASGDW